MASFLRKTKQDASTRIRRRYATSAADTLKDLALLLPWWAGVLIAGFAGGVLWAAHQPHVVVIGGAFAVLAPWLIWVVIRWRWWEYLTRLSPLESIARLPRETFNGLVAASLRAEGWIVVPANRGGVDLMAHRGDEKLLVQTKSWRKAQVRVRAVEELHAMLLAQNATGILVLCGGHVTPAARAFAEGKPFRFIEGTDVVEFVERAPRPSPGEPRCPRCGAPMQRRTARSGANAGRDFLGCTAYPACKGTRAID